MNKSNSNSMWVSAGIVLLIFSLITGTVVTIINHVLGGQLAYVHAVISQAIGIALGFVVIAYGSAKGTLTIPTKNSADIGAVIVGVLVIGVLATIAAVPTVVLWNGLGFTPPMNFIQVTVSTAVGVCVGLRLAMLVETHQQGEANQEKL